MKKIYPVIAALVLCSAAIQPAMAIGRVTCSGDPTTNNVLTQEGVCAPAHHFSMRETDPKNHDWNFNCVKPASSGPLQPAAIAQPPQLTYDPSHVSCNVVWDTKAHLQYTISCRALNGNGASYYHASWSGFTCSK